MEMVLSRCVVRSFRPDDAPSLARHANNRSIWINLRDQFPHPYSLADAERWIREAAGLEPQTHFAIAVDGAAAGAIGFHLKKDVRRLSAEIGYWLGEEFWGRGIATEALRAVTDYAIEHHGLTRIYAVPFAWNVASCRVLEKAGYVLEGRLRNSAIKDGRLTDQMQYAFIVDAAGQLKIDN
jgi:[ribosomal protein S5]-alanine N-acetyltransferase